MSFKTYKKLPQPPNWLDLFFFANFMLPPNSHNWLEPKAINQNYLFSWKKSRKAMSSAAWNHDLAYVVSCEIMMGWTWKRNWKENRKKNRLGFSLSWAINYKSLNKSAENKLSFSVDDGGNRKVKLLKRSDKICVSFSILHRRNWSVAWWDRGGFVWDLNSVEVKGNIDKTWNENLNFFKIDFFNNLQSIS